MILAARVCICAYNTDSLSTCGPWFPACFGSNRDWNHDRHGLLPSHKLRSALNLESFTVQPQLSSMKKSTKIYMMDGNCLYLHECRCILNTFSQHNSTFKTQKAHISVSGYHRQGTDVSQICYNYCHLKCTQGKMKVVSVAFIVVIKVQNNPDLLSLCDTLHHKCV